MKKSITLVVVAIMAITNAVSAANLESSVVCNVKNVEPAAKFVNYADPSLIESELGSLQKSDRSTAEKINADLQITEAVLPAAVVLTQKEAPLNLQTLIRD